MGAKRRSFSPEFKQEAVRVLLESGRPLAHVARELAVRPEQLREWQRQIQAASGEDVSPATPRSDAEELRRVRRELEVVRQERDFLKKAAVSSTGECNTR
jgi:transposase